MAAAMAASSRRALRSLHHRRLLLPSPATSALHTSSTPTPRHFPFQSTAFSPSFRFSTSSRKPVTPQLPQQHVLGLIGGVRSFTTVGGQKLAPLVQGLKGLGPLAEAGKGEAVMLQTDTFWRRNYFPSSLGDFILYIALCRVVSGICTGFVGLSEGLGKYGFMYFSSSIRGLFVCARLTINSDKVHRAAATKLNTSAAIPFEALESKGCPSVVASNKMVQPPTGVEGYIQCHARSVSIPLGANSFRYPGLRPHRNLGAPFARVSNRGFANSSWSVFDQINPKQRIYKYRKALIEPAKEYTAEEYLKLRNPFMRIPNVRILGKDHHHITVPKEAGKVLLHSLLQIICELNTRKLSFQKPLELSDLRITRSYPFYNLSSCEKRRFFTDTHDKFILKEGVLLQPCTNRSVNIDNASGASVLREFVKLCCDADDLPPDLLGDFILMLENMEDRKAPKGYPILVSPALLPLGVIDQAILDIYDLITSNIANEKILSRVVPSDWDRTVKEDELLEMWFNFPRNGYNTKNPWSFMSFLRCVFRHPVKFNDSIGRYTKADLAMLIIFKFPKFLPLLYRNLWRHLRLKQQLAPHRFLMCHNPLDTIDRWPSLLQAVATSTSEETVGSPSIFDVPQSSGYNSSMAKS